MKNFFREYKKLDLVSIQKYILSLWEKEKIFEKSLDNRINCEKFVFYEGPPSANGKPGIHHLLSRTIKDLFCRFHTLKGKYVYRKAGWDTHGLPVELSTEKELGINKYDIGQKISIEDYNNKCKENVLKYTKLWNDITKKIGYWVDLDNPYMTYNSKYIESVWWIIKQIYKKGLLYKGYKIQPYSPKAGTGLSSHELNQPGTYKEVVDTSIVCQFKIIDNKFTIFKEYENIYLLAWTTTPWTLPSNTALTVGRNIDYVIIKTFNKYNNNLLYVILAEKTITNILGKDYYEVYDDNIQNFINSKKIPFFIIKKIKGIDLCGIKYEQIIKWASPIGNKKNAFKVILGDFVKVDEGTGIVHTSPTFGIDDYNIAKDNDVPMILVKDRNNNLVPLVNLDGKYIDFLSTIPDNFKGRYIKNEYSDVLTEDNSVDLDIAVMLKKDNKAFLIEKYRHNYPHCWRTDKPIIYYPLDSWYVKVTQVKKDLIENNKLINWKPSSIGDLRFGKWLENVNDWNISRSRFWGIPLPIWRTKDGSQEIVIESIENLINEINKSIQYGHITNNIFHYFKIGDMSDENYNSIDLHKHILDKIILSTDSGEPMYRESDLIDVWFDSGSMPYAQFHYPFENKDLIDNSMFPAHFIAEGVDQTRGWFYTLHCISTILFNSISYKNVVSNGLVLDKNGHKMSKRLGNTLDPFELINKYGSDILRWYMISNNQPWDNLKFDIKGLEEVKRKFFSTLHNIYAFFAAYSNIDNFNINNDLNVKPDNVLDKWILSKLNSLIIKVNYYYDNYEPTKACRIISNFTIDDLSNWYIRLCRRRLWRVDYNQDKINVYNIIYYCLKYISIISSPIAPFYMDMLYIDLKGKLISVHLEDFPISNKEYIDIELESSMDLLKNITSYILSLRKKYKIKVRQPLRKAIISVVNSIQENINLKQFIDILKNEVNIESIEIITGDQYNTIITKRIKPNFKILGPKYKKYINDINSFCNTLNDIDIRNLENLGYIIFPNPEGNIKLFLNEFIIYTKDIPGWISYSSDTITVAIDINLDEYLIIKGIAREIVNKIQNMRKDKLLNILDRIEVNIYTKNSNLIFKAVNEYSDYIKNEVLCNSIILHKIYRDDLPKIDVNGELLNIKIEKLNYERK